MKSANNNKWDIRFLLLADQIATWSKDPSRGVGAIIVSDAKQIVATGFNGLPRGVEDRAERLERPAKYELIVHAEMNAIIQCARNGVSPLGCTMFTTFSPCVACAIVMVQAGIARVVTWEPDLVGADAHWLESIRKAQSVLKESGVIYEICTRPAQAQLTS